MKKMMVVGASGVLGKLVCIELLRIFENQINLIVTDYKAERGKKLADSFNGGVQFQYLNVNDEENVKKAVKNVDIVIVVLKQRIPSIQKSCIENKILCIDVTPFYGFVEKVNELNEIAENNNIGSVIMSGFFPGLSGLMVKEAISNFQEVSEVNVGLLQNTNAKAGVDGILDMLKIIDQPINFQNKVISGFTKKRNMYFLNHNNEKEVRLIKHSEKIPLNDKLVINQINYWTSWNCIAFNKQVSLLRKIGFIKMIHKVNNKLLSKVVNHNPNKNESAFLTVEVKGMVDNQKRIKILSLSTFSDYHTTAMVTASLAKVAHQKNVKGVVYPFEVTSLDELLSIINCPNIVIEEFEK
ncbi:saccharopine dehydrogenase NADP-binding domain-containing protein [Bacillus paralicheniformis]|uniref:saccharopine dehydrogenase NADP-binding domain-containing protein n=1 Tax=Bacillus paralicheniformis TaxID=1648923 RepID=UPI0022827F9F|nr:saccharopine dehydrogenase NADP-binding domain-containing protein [Bacillus paralicheniformis]MCY8181057.1 saccharopine dehydrogenase NADP-binding domain-containing protein [Bacillus paralicheniformis]